MTAADTLPGPRLTDPAALNDQIAERFHRHFAAGGSRRQPAAGIVSKVDPSVRFIGSAISVLKSMLQTGAIPRHGAHVVQPAIRTQNLRVLPEPDAHPRWGSYFRALGTLAGPDGLHRTVVDVWRFLHDALGIAEHRLVARAHSADRDIVAALAATCPAESLELQGQPLAAYRHRYGLDAVAGRNCNLAIRGPNGDPVDIGNVVVIEGPSGVLGVEFASGVSTLLAGIHGLVHPHQAGAIASAMPVDSWNDVRLADAVATTTAMFIDGLRPGGRGRRRTMRGYLACLDQLRLEAGWAAGDVARVAAEFARREFGSAGGVDAFLIACLSGKERDVPEPDFRRRLPSVRHHLDALHPRHTPVDRLPARVEVPLGPRPVLPASTGHEWHQRAGS